MRMPSLLYCKSACKRADIEMCNQRRQIGSGEKRGENERCENDEDDEETDTISDIIHAAFERLFNSACTTCILSHVTSNAFFRCYATYATHCLLLSASSSTTHFTQFNSNERS